MMSVPAELVIPQHSDSAGGVWGGSGETGQAHVLLLTGASCRESPSNMDTSISRRVAARPALIFSLAAHVEHWPRLLPHYRWVRVLEQRSPVERVVDMAARRQIAGRIAIPLHWTSVQWLDPERCVIGFEHIAGISRGMQVTWTIVQESDDCVSRATIRHVFSPAWPVPRALVGLIVGEFVVNSIAMRTLRTLGDLAVSAT
jgi:ribosome-associated toxin RatA of RatAB toxin-antitoxin module